MKLTKEFVLNEKVPLKDQLQTLDLYLKKISDCMQGRIRFGTATDGYRGENISGEYQVVTDTGNADTEFTVAHSIGAVPTGFLVTNISKGGVIYDSGTSWTSSNIYLKCSAANANVTLFLLQ